jgi:putative transposase
MQRSINFSVGEFYHVFNRGVEKRKIFLTRKDYERFLILLFFCNDISPVRVKDLYRQGFSLGPSLGKFEKEGELVDIGAYCLMPNHFHLLLREKAEGGVSTFLRKLCTAYSMYFNKRNERVGALFQSRFGAQHLDEDNYLKYIFAYIHLNPIKLLNGNWKNKGYFKNPENKQGAEKFLKDYKWSSYGSYVGENKDNYILNQRAFPDYFEEIKGFRGFINDWLSFS